MARKARGYTCYFARGEVGRDEMDAAGVVRSPGARRVRHAVRDWPGASNKDLAGVTGLSPATVSHHIKRLGEAGIVSVARGPCGLRVEAAWTRRSTSTVAPDHRPRSLLLPAEGLSRVDVEQRIRQLEAEQERLLARVAELEGRRPQGPTEPAQWARPHPASQGRQTPREPRQRLDAAGLEQRIGGRWLAYAGVVVFVIGAVFFLRLVIDQGLLGPLARVVLGVVAGTAMWGTGAWLDRRGAERVYGQVLAGGGAAVLYFTIYAAHFFPTLRAVTGIGLHADAVLLGLVAAGLAAYAAVRRAQALAHVSLVLVGTTTIAAGSWSGFSVVYLVSMVAVMLSIAAWRRWPVVQVAGLGAFLVLLAAGLNGVGDAAVVAGAAALLATHAAAGFWPRTERRHVPDLIQAGAFLLAWLVIYGSLDAPWHGPATVLLALAAFLLTATSFLRAAPGWGWGLAGAALLFIWAPIQFDGPHVALVWGLWCFTAGMVTVLRPLPGIGVPWLIGCGVLWFRLQAEELPSIDAGMLHVAWAALGGLAAVAALTPAWSSRADGERWTTTRHVLGTGIGLWVLLATIAAVLDGPLVSMAWAGVAVAALAIGAALRRRDIRLGGIATFVPVVGRVVIVDLADVDPVLRVLSYLAVGGLLLLVSFLYARQVRTTVAAAPPGESGPPQ